MYRFYIESVTKQGWTSKEWNVYPLSAEACEGELIKSLLATKRAGRVVLRYWLEKVPEELPKA